MLPHISIAMATYNGARFLQAQLESFAAQISCPYELIICDDGSGDETVEIARNFAKNAPFPVHIHVNEKNLGFSDNFMQAASLCRGSWIAFSDQDDVWLPEKIQKIQHAIVRANGSDLLLVTHSGCVVDEGLNPTGVRVPDFRKDEIRLPNHHGGFLCIPGFSIAFRADLLCGIDSTRRPRDYFEPRDMKQSHDKWIPMLANALGSIAYLSKPLVFYRRHSQACTGSHAQSDAIQRIQKSTHVGASYYRFQSEVAMDCASCFRELAATQGDINRAERLRYTASLYQKLSQITASRSILYENVRLFGRFSVLYKMIKSGAYWGNPFCTLGWLSFLKDVCVTFGLLETSKD